MACDGGCVSSFLNNPINVAVVVISLLLALGLLTLFLYWKKSLKTNTKLVLLYGFLLFTVFPFVFYYYNRTCRNTFLSCNPFQALMLSLLGALGISLTVSFVLTPFLYRLSSRTKVVEQTSWITAFVQKAAVALGIGKPHLFIIDKAEPAAFSSSQISPTIFLTVGMIELLNRKELQAVLLHELGHLRQKTSFLKFSNNLFRSLTFVSPLLVLHDELNQEERDADEVAISLQGTPLYLRAAKEKVKEYLRWREKGWGANRQKA